MVAANNNAQKTVLVDTCFLIALYNRNSPFFKSARSYYEYFLKNNFIMYISTIVISEFNQLFSIAKIIESNDYHQLTFSYRDALAVGEVAFHLGLTDRDRKDNSDEEDANRRAEIKDDIKILGQVKFRCADYLISSDEKMLKKCQSLNASGIIDCKPIDIGNSFDSSLFKDNGQTNMLDSVDDI